MNLAIHRNAAEANDAAADMLARWLVLPEARNIMLAAGNTPLELYRRIAERSGRGADGKNLRLDRLHLFALDEYVGVPRGEPRNCANLIRRAAAQAWGVPDSQYFTVSSVETEAPESLRAHEENIAHAGGIDVIVLGLGQNGHLGFNEPGSAEDSPGRVLDLEPSSIEANRLWFGGEFAPARGATVGLKTILGSRRVLLLAYGPHKTAAVQAMVQGPRSSACPASFLQGHPQAHVFLDATAAAGLKGNGLR